MAITTLGCKVNQYESASFLSALQERQGVEVVPFSQKADLYLVNTCAVTGKAGAQSRRTIRQALQRNAKARVVVTGCYSQVAADDVAALGEGRAIAIVGNGYKDLLVDFALGGGKGDLLDLNRADIGRGREACHLPVQRFAGRTRAYVKIQDGCDSFCTYCIVPYARGRSRSVPLELALGQVRMFSLAGVREIVVTGIHVGQYGHDLHPATSLATFLRQATALHPHIRFRLSSLEPTELTEEMLALFQECSNLLPHLHIPLQSGDSGILAAMNRRYDAKDFAQAIKRAHELLPQAAIGVDIMAGFPGESEEAFVRGYELLASLPITYLHVFPYSRRPGTKAADLPGQVVGPEKSRRVKLLLELGKTKREEFYQRFLGQTMAVLAENNRNKKKLMKGFSPNYIPVYFSAPAAVKNRVVDVRITRLAGEDVYGEVVHAR